MSATPKAHDRLAAAATLGYATRSLRSAIFMRGIDCLNPAAADRGPCRLEGMCVVSSVAGVGDLFIHLPLIEGILAEVRRNGGTPVVALRPSHAAIGRACGWDVVEFENPLQDVFGGTVNRKVLGSMQHDFREMRRRKPDLWLDLTGNAFNALHLRMLGVHRLAARVTRGGRSLVHHWLPNKPFENEYANRQRLADHLGVHLEPSVYERLCRREPRGHIVLGASTNCRWRDWPLSRFSELVSRFPEREFVLTGLSREVNPGSEHDLETLIRQPNVTNRMDRLALRELVESITTADAVVTNDTGTAHIASAWGVPGAVLFGPGISEQWSAPSGLLTFHDCSCPHYPCVAWRCASPENWCMEKIAVGPVAEHLRSVLLGTSASTPASSPALP